MSKKPGAVSAETKICILNAAREEFAACGYQGSSLRRIGSAAGVTTGAIYFFFAGKDDLFRAVLSAVTKPFMAYMAEHYHAEQTFLSKSPADNVGEDLAVSAKLIDLYFQNPQTWDILLKHQSHPAVREFLNQFVEDGVRHYRSLLSLAQQSQPRKHPVDDFALHQFVHMQSDTMLTLISRNFSREEMIAHSKTMTKMLRGAFTVLLSE